MKENSDVKSVLKDDGINDDSLKNFHIFENKTTVNIDDLRKRFGMNSWAVRIAYNEFFAGVIIQRRPGEGNRKHFHPDADENWVILDGEWEWWIENKGVKIVKKNDIVVVPKGVWHQIKCIGNSPGVRYAITIPDVNHVYEK